MANNMSLLYSITGIIMIIGLIAFLYGIQTLSFTLFIEGIFLLWIGFSITTHSMNDQRDLYSEN